MVKGYKTVNGNYITKKEQEEGLKRFRKQCQEAREKREKEEQFKEKLIISEILEKRREQKRLQQEKEDLINKKREITSQLAGNLIYKEFIIMYDLFNSSFYEIKNNLMKNKITYDNINKVIDLVNNIYPILNKNDILDFIQYA